MKSTESAPNRGQFPTSFTLFALTALLLAIPLGEPMRAGSAWSAGLSIRAAELGINAVAWILRCTGLVLMAQLANSRAGDLRLILTRYFLFVFLLYFALERLGTDIAAWWPAAALTHSLPLIRVFSSIAVALGAALALPQVRGIRTAFAGEATEHARFLAAAENTLDDFYIFDGVPDAKGDIVDFRFSYINPNAERRLRTPRENFIGRILTEVRPFMTTSGLIEKYREVVRTGIPFTTEVYLDDELIQGTWLNVQVVKLGRGIAITSRDVTETRRMADRIHHMAHHDQLTGVANRTLFEDRAQQALLRARRQKQKVAFFMLDIDCFKAVNDSLGHTEGDALLVAVAKRLLASVRETDTVARIGGDEFVVLMPEFHNLDDVRRCGSNIIRNVSHPLDLAGRALTITASLGASIYPDDGLELEDLLKKADDAMYAVKGANRDGLRLYGDGMPESGAMVPRGNTSGHSERSQNNVAECVDRSSSLEA